MYNMNPENINVDTFDSQTVELDGSKRVLRKLPPKHWSDEEIEKATVYATGSIVLDNHANLAYHHGKRMRLGKIQLKLLSHLICNSHSFCSRESLMELLLEAHKNRPVESNALNKQINNIRDRLDCDEKFNYLTTQYTIGYKWDIPVYKFYIDRSH